MSIYRGMSKLITVDPYCGIVQWFKKVAIHRSVWTEREKYLKHIKWANV